MTVVELLAARRNKLRRRAPGGWQPGEIAELMKLYAVLNDCDVTIGYEFGNTESREPQFYVLAADQNCISCVSRISKDSRPWYVVEDGLGGLLAEGYSLDILVSHLRTCWLSLLNKLLPSVIFTHELFSRATLTAESFFMTSYLYVYLVTPA